MRRNATGDGPTRATERAPGATCEGNKHEQDKSHRKYVYGSVVFKPLIFEIRTCAQHIGGPLCGAGGPILIKQATGARGGKAWKALTGHRKRGKSADPGVSSATRTASGRAVRSNLPAVSILQFPSSEKSGDQPRIKPMQNHGQDGYGCPETGVDAGWMAPGAGWKSCRESPGCVSASVVYRG